MTDALPADVGLLDLLRKSGPLSVAELAQAMQVTATAVRQRLVRLMDQGCVRRSAIRARRGRPSHRYELTQLGQRQTGANFADLAVALWQEIRAIKDPEVRRGLLERVSKRLAAIYATQIQGETLEERMQSLASLFTTRRIPLEVERRDQLPVLHVHACPYPELAEQDAGICAMEKLLFAELLGERMKLDECRLDGARCCTFQRGEN